MECVHQMPRSEDVHSYHARHASAESKLTPPPKLYRGYTKCQPGFSANLYRLKCDRARPCDNCVKRREADTCMYPTNGSASRDQTRESKKTKKRIERLESLVMELLDRGALNQESLSEGHSTSESDSQALFHIPHQASENGHETDISTVQREPIPVQRPSSLPASSSSSSLWETVLQDVSYLALTRSTTSRNRILTVFRLEKSNRTLKSMRMNLKNNSER